MPSLSHTFIVVRLPSGNRALYRVQPQHVSREGIPESYQWPTQYGTQWAVEIDGQWRYAATTWGYSGPSGPIVDPKLLRCIEQVPSFA